MKQKILLIRGKGGGGPTTMGFSQKQYTVYKSKG